MSAKRHGALARSFAALALIGVLWGWEAWAQQATTKKDEAAQILSQKAMMLEVYLGSERVAAALRSGEPKNLEAVDRARQQLAAGAEALEKGDLALAEQSLNAGLHQISTLVLQGGAQAENLAKKKVDFHARRQQIDSFINALEGGSEDKDLSPWKARLAVATKGLDDAEALYGEEKYAEAYAKMVSIYEDVVLIVSEARANQSIIYRLDFETPADEYAYELERNKSYDILVDIAVAEKQNSAKALRPYIQKMVGQSRELRDKAKAQAAEGDHVAAIETLENATRYLVRALNSAGVAVME